MMQGTLRYFTHCSYCNCIYEVSLYVDLSGWQRVIEVKELSRAVNVKLAEFLSKIMQVIMCNKISYRIIFILKSLMLDQRFLSAVRFFGYFM